MAYAYPRNGKWYVGYKDERGKERQRVTAATSEAAAEKIARKYEADAELIRLGLLAATPTPRTLRDVAEAYKETIKRRRSYASTKGRIDNHLLPTLIEGAPFGDRFIHEIDPGNCDALFTAIAFDAKENPSGLAPQTVRHCRNTLKKIFDFAILKKSWLKSANPVLGAEKITVVTKLANPVDIERLAPLFRVLDPWWVALFKTGVGCGLRKGELCALLVGDVDLVRRRIKVLRSNDNDTTKTATERFVAIPINLVAVLMAQIGTRPASAPLFPDVDGEMIPPYKKLARMLRTALKNSGAILEWEVHCRPGASARLGKRTEWGCGFKERRSSGEEGRCPKCTTRAPALWVRPIPIHHTFQDLRSTFANILYEATGNRRAVSKQMGHGGDGRTTERHYLATEMKHFVALADMMPLGETLAAGATPSFSEGAPTYTGLTTPAGRGFEGVGAPENPLSRPGVTASAPGGTRTHDPRLRRPMLGVGVPDSSGLQRVIPSVFYPAPVLHVATADSSVPYTGLTSPAPSIRVLQGGRGLYTVREVAELLHLDPSTIRKRINALDLAAERLGSGHVLIRGADVRALISKGVPGYAPKPLAERPLGEATWSVLAYVASCPTPPSRAEVMRHFGWSSAGSLSKVKRALAAHGFIHDVAGGKRDHAGLRITKAGRAALEAHHAASKGKP